jgi:aminodeoxyfutalosine deaminase
VTWAPGVPEWSTDRSDTAGSAACTDPFTATFVQHLPKVELHLHLVGAVGPATLERLLEGPGDDAPPSPILGQPDEQGFLTTFRAVTSRVRRPEDVVALVEDAGHRLASTNVRYAEVTVTVASHLRAGIGPTDLRDALDEGRRRVRRDQDVDLAWIVDISGHHGPGAGWDTVRWISRHAPMGTVGFGLGGPEREIARADYREVFRAARSLGLRSTPHAGEHGDPGQVRSALDALGADRVGHGIAAADDDDLLRELAERQVTLEVCPTSNVATGAVRSYADHPLPALLDAGVPVTVATDDPGVFDTDLNHEYRLAAEICGLDPDGIVALVSSGIEAAFCDPSRKAELSAELDRAVAHLHGR